MNLCIKKKSNISNEYLNLSSSLGFLNLSSFFDSCLNVPTRGNCCLDHVFIRPCKYLYFKTELVTTDSTDHYGAVVVCNCSVNFTPKFNYYKPIDFSLLTRRLREVSWSSIYDTNCVKDSLTNFYNTCLDQSSFLKSNWISDALVKKCIKKINCTKCIRNHLIIT